MGKQSTLWLHYKTLLCKTAKNDSKISWEIIAQTIAGLRPPWKICPASVRWPVTELLTVCISNSVLFSHEKRKRTRSTGNTVYLCTFLSGYTVLQYHINMIYFNWRSKLVQIMLLIYIIIIILLLFPCNVRISPIDGVEQAKSILAFRD